MKRIMIFAGTSEGRELAEELFERGYDILVCVASDYGREMLKGLPSGRIRVGRMDTGEMEALIREWNGETGETASFLVVDATHPYAEEASRNIRSACARAGVECLRLLRPSAGIVKEFGGIRDEGAKREASGRTEAKDVEGEAFDEEQGGDITRVASGVIEVGSIVEAARYLARHEGRALITTGSRELEAFREIPGFEGRLTVRVLPSSESLSACRRAGFDGKHIIAMQGPFSVEMNELMLRETGAAYLVTKESGDAGGFREKLSAAERAGAKVILVRRPKEEGLSFGEVLKRCGAGSGDPGESADPRVLSAVEGNAPENGQPYPERPEPHPERSASAREVFLVGCGCGDARMLTGEAREAIRRADILIGSRRLLKAFSKGDRPVFEAWRSGEIRGFLDSHPEYGTAVVLFSGDVGFYSGAGGLLEALSGAEGSAAADRRRGARWKEPVAGEDGALREEPGTGDGEAYRVKLLCGISSVQYFCAKCGIPWEDVCLVSAHGRDVNLAAAIRRNRRVFSLMEDGPTLKALMGRLCDCGLGHIPVLVGVNLSYPDEEIRETTVEGFRASGAEGLVVVIFQNDAADEAVVTHGIPDAEFVRGEIPMTKEEVRSVVLSKLRITRSAVVYDIGAGTGSVAVECALAAEGGRVYAVERRAEGAGLIAANARHFGLMNVEVVMGEAPEALEGLPVPTHAFIGGSGGRFGEICDRLREKNPRIRIVATAVTLEGIRAVTEYINERELKDAEVVQISAAKSRRAGEYHLMAGMNPVLVAAWGGPVSFGAGAGQGGGTPGVAAAGQEKETKYGITTGASKSGICKYIKSAFREKESSEGKIGTEKVPTERVPGTIKEVPGFPAPRLLVAAPRSGSGKTLVTCGLMRAFQERGLRARGMKCGPDFIDPMFHEKTLGVRSRNLDGFLMSGEQMAQALVTHSRGADLTVIEGVMGFYDGSGAVTTACSSYETAARTRTPVLLVVDAAGASVSVASVIRGIRDYRADSGIAGVVLNRISLKTAAGLAPLIEKETGLPVVGVLERKPEFAIGSRHLGLMMPHEIGGIEKKLEDLAAYVAGHFDLDRILEIAKGAPGLDVEKAERAPEFVERSGAAPDSGEGERVRIAVACDEAFCFLYEDNIRLLEEMGAEITYFSPLHDAKLPRGTKGLILPGGYPELYAGQLSGNETMRSSIRTAADDGLPIMAECGGFLYLHRELMDQEGRTWPMTGVLDAEAWYAGRTGRFGYIELRDAEDSLRIRAHEFHAFESSDPGEAFAAVKPVGGQSWRCMHEVNGGLVGFPHLYYPSCPQAAERFLERCRGISGRS